MIDILLGFLFGIWGLVGSLCFFIPSILVGCLSTTCSIVIGGGALLLGAGISVIGAIAGIVLGLLGAIAGAIVGFVIGAGLTAIVEILFAVATIFIWGPMAILIIVVTLGLGIILLLPAATVIISAGAFIAIVVGIIGAILGLIIGGLIGLLAPVAVACVIGGIIGIIPAILGVCCFGIGAMFCGVGWSCICLPSIGLMFIESFVSLGACCLIPISFPFLFCPPLFWGTLCFLWSPISICFAFSIFGCGVGILAGVFSAILSFFLGIVGLLGIGMGAVCSGLCCAIPSWFTGCLAPLGMGIHGLFLLPWTCCIESFLCIMVGSMIPANLGYCLSTSICPPLWLGWICSCLGWLSFVNIFAFGVCQWEFLEVCAVVFGAIPWFCCPCAFIPALGSAMLGIFIGIPILLSSLICGILSFIPLLICGAISWLCWIPCLLVSGFFSIFCPCVFEIPTTIWCLGHCLSCSLCNLIDICWLFGIPASVLGGWLSAQTALLVCPCTAIFSPIALCAPFALIAGKLCYMGVGCPYLICLEPLYLSWLCFDIGFYLCGLPFYFICAICSTPLLPFTWLGSSAVCGVCGITVDFALITLLCGVAPITVCGGSGLAGSLTCFPCGLCVAGVLPPITAFIGLFPVLSKLFCGPTAVCPVNQFVGAVIQMIPDLIDILTGPIT